MKGLPVLNGEGAKAAITYATLLLGLLIVAIAAIVVVGREIPDVFVVLASGLLGALVGFISGSRVTPPDAYNEILQRRANEVLPAISDRPEIATTARNVVEQLKE